MNAFKFQELPIAAAAANSCPEHDPKLLNLSFEKKPGYSPGFFINILILIRINSQINREFAFVVALHDRFDHFYFDRSFQNPFPDPFVPTGTAETVCW